MAETMVERVARALWIWGECEQAFDDIGQLSRDLAMSEARAAIEAMREPTPEMVAATLPIGAEQATEKATYALAERALFLLEGDKAMDAGAHIKGVLAAEALIRDWRAMIAVALKEGA